MVDLKKQKKNESDINLQQNLYLREEFDKENLRKHTKNMMRRDTIGPQKPAHLGEKRGVFSRDPILSGHKISSINKERSLQALNKTVNQVYPHTTAKTNQKKCRSVLNGSCSYLVNIHDDNKDVHRKEPSRIKDTVYEGKIFCCKP